MMIGRCIAWRKLGTEQGTEQIMKRIAYATRYGGATLTEACHVDQQFLQDFLIAVSDIVREENKASRK